MASRLPLTARGTLDMVDRELKHSGNDDDSCRGNCGLRLSSQQSSGRTAGRRSCARQCLVGTKSAPLPRHFYAAEPYVWSRPQ